MRQIQNHCKNADIVKIQYPCNMIPVLSFVLFHEVIKAIFKIHIKIVFQLIKILKIPMQCLTFDTCMCLTFDSLNIHFVSSNVHLHINYFGKYFFPTINGILSCHLTTVCNLTKNIIITFLFRPNTQSQSIRHLTYLLALALD